MLEDGLAKTYSWIQTNFLKRVQKELTIGYLVTIWLNIKKYILYINFPSKT